MKFSIQTVKKYVCGTGSESLFSWMLISQIASLGSIFLGGLFAARTFGPSMMGEWNYAVAFTAMFTPILHFGLESIIIKDLSQNTWSSGEILASSVPIFVVCQMLAVLICIGFGTIHFDSGDRSKFILLNILPWLFYSVNICKYYLISKSKLRIYSILICMVSLLFFVLKLLACFNNRFMIYAVFASSEIIAAIIVQYLATRFEHISFSHLRFSKTLFLKYLKLGFPFMLSSFSCTILMKIDQIMIGDILGDRELGIYAVAVLLSECWYMVPTALYTSFLPKVSFWAEEDKEKYRKTMQKLADYLVLLSYFAFALIQVIGRWFVPFLYGNEYIEAGRLMQVYIFAGFFAAISYHFSAYTAIKEMSKYSFAVTFSSCALNVVLNYILIRWIGSMGAVIATIATHLYANIVFHACAGIFNREIHEILKMEIRAFFPFFRIAGYLREIK